MLDWLQFVLAPQVVNGLSIGVAVVLMALGLTIIFGLLDVINMAHGEFYAIGAYAALALIGVGLPFWWALALTPLLMAAVGWAFIKDPEARLGPNNWLSLAIALVVGVLIVCLDILAPRKKLAVFSGAFLGLIVGISIAYALSFVTALLVDQYVAATKAEVTSIMRDGVVQFIKGAWHTGEKDALAAFGDKVVWHTMGEGFTWETQDHELDVAAAKRAWDKAKELLADPTLGLVILDELNIALRYDYLDLDEIVSALKARRDDLHVIVTGRNAKQPLLDAADLVTEMTLVKHHFAAGVKAQQGIEF